MYGGSFIAFLTIPGGSNFNARIPLLVADARPRVAKYGVIMFVRNDFIYIISMELAEHAIEGGAYHQTAEKENVILRGRLLDIASQMQFTKPPPRRDRTCSSTRVEPSRPAAGRRRAGRPAWLVQFPDAGGADPGRPLGQRQPVEGISGSDLSQRY